MGEWIVVARYFDVDSDVQVVLEGWEMVMMVDYHECNISGGGSSGGLL